MRTFKQTLLKLLGYRLIPGEHVVLIMRDDQPIRLAGPGYIRKNPLSETYGPMWKPNPNYLFSSGSNKPCRLFVRAKDD